MSILLYCRPGFERDCALEFAARAEAFGGTAKPQFGTGSGYVEATLEASHALPGELLAVQELVFARQAAQIVARVAPLPERDRAAPLIEAAREARIRAHRLLLETPDTNEGKTLSGFTRRFAPILEDGLRQARLLVAARAPQLTLHVFFPDRECALLAQSDAALASPHPMGILRLRMPAQAPSRSSLKLAEALLLLVGEERLGARMKPGAQAVDLGAAPGGWSWQLAQRGLRVMAVDNAKLAPAVLATQLVEHVRSDAFAFRPRKPVAWMVCDVVEQPIRVAGLAADWIARGWCRDTIFNLKLPMKKRFEEWVRCRDQMQSRLRRAGTPYLLAAKQLYHDRQEMTVYLSTRS